LKSGFGPKGQSVFSDSFSCIHFLVLIFYPPCLPENVYKVFHPQAAGTTGQGIYTLSRVSRSVCIAPVFVPALVPTFANRCNYWN
jgi:hypothetical protein